MIASPWLFDLVHVSSAAIFIAHLYGLAATDYGYFCEGTKPVLLKQFPIQIHMVITAALMGFILFISPFLYTFSYKAHWPELFLGGFLDVYGDIY